MLTLDTFEIFACTHADKDSNVYNMTLIYSDNKFHINKT